MHKVNKFLHKIFILIKPWLKWGLLLAIKGQKRKIFVNYLAQTGKMSRKRLQKNFVCAMIVCGQIYIWRACTCCKACVFFFELFPLFPPQNITALCAIMTFLQHTCAIIWSKTAL